MYNKTMQNTDKHAGILDLSNQEALTALEKLTHATHQNPHPVMPLSASFADIPAMFRRAAIHAALGSARSFYSHLRTWKGRKEKAEAKGKKFHERPPVPPRTWNKSATLYAGMWKERSRSSMVLKVWTGTCWSWVKVRITGRELPTDAELGSPQLIRNGNRWWLHTPIEKQFKSPGKIEKQVATNPETKICAVDLNINENIAVCTIQTVKGSILATTFIGGGRRISGFRKKLLGRIPERGKYSRRSNTKRAFWIKGRIFRYAKYKAWNAGIITSRVSPRNTSQECARCHAQVFRYEAGQEASGYTPGAPLVLCHECHMADNADRNASPVIGQRLITRSQKFQEKPHAPLATERIAKAVGVVVCQDAKGEEGPSILQARHADGHEHGTAHDVWLGMAEHTSDIPHPLRPRES